MGDVTDLNAVRERKRRRKCEWCGRRNNLERFGEDAFICRDQRDCEKHWPDEWPEGTRGVPEDRIAGRARTDASLTACDELELRRRAADGDQDAMAEMARRNRMRVGRAQANPKDYRAPDRREPSTGYVSTGRKVGPGSGGGSVGSLVA
jgi:hypothetical protein